MRRSDLAAGENPGVQELGHPVASLNSAALLNGETALYFWEDNLKLPTSLTGKDACELQDLNPRACCAEFWGV